MFASSKSSKRSNNRRRHMNGGYFLQKFLKMKNVSNYVDVDDHSSSSPAYASLMALQVETTNDDDKQQPWVVGDDLRVPNPNGSCYDSSTILDRSKLTISDAAVCQLDRKFINVDKLRPDVVDVFRNSNKENLTSRLLPSSINDESSSSPNRGFNDICASSTSSMTARLRSSSSPTYIRNASCTTVTNRAPSLLINQLISPTSPQSEYLDRSKCYSPASRACRFTLLFDPAGSFCYYWSLVVSVAFLYNLWVIIYRYTFDEIDKMTLIRWFCLDYSCDVIYILDIVMQFRTGFLDEGVLQTNPTKLRLHYVNSTRFYLDCLSLLPLDFLYLSIGFMSILRTFRLVKLYKFWFVVEKTERHTNNPNALRSLLLFHTIVLVFHWNACLIFSFRSYLNYKSNYWDEKDNFNNYLSAFYLSCRTLMLIESLPMPHKDNIYRRYGLVFIIFEQICGLVMLATVLGHVAGIVANVSAGRKHFQAQLDSVKTYMRIRKVPNHLQRKVIRWFDYWWKSKKYGNDKEVLECLPDKLKAEIAINVHLDTLKRVEIFQNTEPGFLCELVIRLKPMLFSPGDYICRKGEVGKEMYIVNRGKLEVLADDGDVVLATLKAGSYFGEISILNMGTEGNRRTASVVSVGYSDLFCLTKKEIWEVLEDYPAARARLELIANKRLRQKAQKLSTVIPREPLIESNESPGLPAIVEASSISGRRRSAPAGMRSNVKSSYHSEIGKYRNSESKAILNKNLSSPLKLDQLETASVAYASTASTLYDVEDSTLDDGKRSDKAQLLSRTPSKTRSSSKDFKNEAMSNDSPSPCYETPLNSGETIRLTLYDNAQEDII